MNIAVTGSLAYDHIMVFPDAFERHVLADKTHMINVCFAVDQLSKEFGGTAGNIAYNLKLLELDPIIVATAGKDFAAYKELLHDRGISSDAVLVIEDEFTAQAYITTDIKDNQIAAFYGGAMYRAHEQSLKVLETKPDVVIISPNGLDAMVDHAQYCREYSIPFWFDPGQSLSALSPDQLLACLDSSEGLFVNDYEWELLKKALGLQDNEILQKTKEVIVTRGGESVLYLGQGQKSEVLPVPGLDVVDPTGAGDAFRAGYFFAIAANKSRVESLRYGCAVSSFAIEKKGTQNHVFDHQALQERYDQVKILS